MYFSHVQSSQVPSSASATPPVQSSAPQPTFPAYQGQPNVAAGPPPVATLPKVPIRVSAKVPPVGANSKLMHPEDDISMVSINDLVQTT